MTKEKQSAYDTLYGCLVTLSKLIAPFTPFLAEDLYRNLVSAVDDSAPESVHLAEFPEADESLIAPALNDEALLAMKVSSLGRAARSKAGLKVRQPLSAVKVVVRGEGEREALRRSFAEVGEELNVKALEFAESASEVYDYKVSANTPLLGPKYGKDTPKIVKGLSSMDPGEVARVVQAGGNIEVSGFTLAPEEVNLESVEKEGMSVAAEGDYVVAVPTIVSEELAKEGMARELVHRLQTMRRSAGFEVVDQIVSYMVGDGAPAEALARPRDLREAGDACPKRSSRLHATGGGVRGDAQAGRPGSGAGGGEGGVGLARLVEDEAGGDEALLYWVDSEAQAFKGVSAQEGKGVVLGEDDQGGHAIAVNRGAGLTVVHLDSAPVC